MKAAVEFCVDTYGGLDVLHNNAAALGPDVHGRDTQIVDAQVEVWDKTMAVNLRGVMLGCKYAIPRMIERGGGVIVNTSSTAALAAGPAAAAYAASKAAIISLTRHVAARYGRDGIRCIAIAPGHIVNPRTAAAPWFTAMMRPHQPVPRQGVPQDIANGVAFLVSEEASFISGILLPIDGAHGAARPTFATEMEHLLEGAKQRIDV
jgi:NAD(P)-dependent dehydrogenase (short-subunit alcohol dehydrogenase family)